ncbi:aromatic-ring hydroxylase C-terminal domain-containing protein [Streptomyces sp. YKOK-I1]
MNLGRKLAATLSGDAPGGPEAGPARPRGARAGPRPDRDPRRNDLRRRETVRIVGPPRLGDDHPLVGRTAPELRREDGTRLGDLLREGCGVALDFTSDGRLRDAAQGWGERIRYAAGAARNALGPGAVPIRPDGIVAWAGKAGGDVDRDAFERAVGRWFGSPED